MMEKESLDGQTESYRVSWPQAKDENVYESVDRNLEMLLEGQVKLKRIGKLIYSYGLERFGRSSEKK